MSGPKTTLVVGTRTSKLARWQTQFIIGKLQRTWRDLECHTRTFKTEGDEKIDQPLPEIGGKGLFTERLERALRERMIDIAVHSLKDLPVEDSAGLVIGAITSRVDPRDVLVSAEGYTVDSLPQGAVVGTSSNRRQAQLLARRPDLVIKPIRGNVETRVRKVLDGEYDAAVLAAAGLERLGVEDGQVVPIDIDVMLPAPGQAALAIQCREDDERTLHFLSGIEDETVREAVTAERMFLLGLGGGCAAPVAAYARTLNGGRIVLQGLVASTEGARVIRVKDDDVDGAVLGVRLAREARALGADEILGEARTGAAGPPALEGRRIVVTRAGAQARGLLDGLRTAGAVPVHAPTIRVETLYDTQTAGDVIGRIHGADWVVMTSVNGIKALSVFVNGSQAARELLAGKQVAAVGPATAAALEDIGVSVDFVPQEFTGDAIAAGIDDIAGKRVVLLRAETAGQAIVDVLTARGAQVEDIPVYRTVEAGMTPEMVADIGRGVDALSFTSGSTARGFASAWRKAGRDLSAFAHTPVFCIGPVTEEAASELGFEVRIVADTYTTEGLIDTMKRYFNKEQK